MAAVNVGHRPVEGAYFDGAAVTPHDSNNLAGGACSALWIGTGGDGTLRVLTSQGTTLNFAAIGDGYLLKLSVLRVFSTGTGASNIIALY